MTLEMTRAMLGWCTLINIGLLLWWFLIFWLAHDWMYRLHSKMFKLSVESFDMIHYAGMAMLKVAICLLNLVPYLALLIIR